MTSTMLPSENEAWGFFGTMSLVGADPVQAWNAASAMIAAETDASPEGVRAFLDSRHGRHFADSVIGRMQNGLPVEDAVEDAITEWQGWRINRRTSSETGIPRGLPYLTGFTSHFTIMAELDD